MSDWKEQLRQRFEEHPADVPGDLWQGIESELAGKRKGFPWLWTVTGVSAAAAAAALLFMVGSPAVRPSGEEAVAVVEQPSRTETLPEETVQAVPSDLVADAVPLRKAVRPASRPAVSRETVPSAVPGTLPEPVPETLPETVPETVRETVPETVPETAPEELPVSPATPATDKKSSATDRGTAPSLSLGPDPFAALDTPGKSFRPRIQAGVRMSSGSESTSQFSSYGLTSELTRAGAGEAATLTDFPYLLSTNRLTETTVTHREPIHYGITLSLRFAPRWSVETGLMRSDLVSYLYSTTDMMGSETEQSLRCIGVPMTLRYDLTRPDRRVGLYAGTGFIWEKALEMETVSRASIGNYSQRESEVDDCPKFHQWSAQASLGIQVRPVRKGPLAFFLEPGLTWHFENGSDIQTCYDARPFSYTLSAGLRVLFE